MRRLSARRAASLIPLRDGSEVVVIGGGPAGSFFAISLLRGARLIGRKLSVSIFEKKREPTFYESEPGTCSKEGCNYCAGGISPRLMDALAQEGLAVPESVSQSEVSSITIHGHWKNIELDVPQGRRMTCVFRGSRPRNRPHRYANLDGYLLAKAAEWGAEVVTAEVLNVSRSRRGRPRLTFNRVADGRAEILEREADFMAVAAGVNQAAGIDLASNRFQQSLPQLIPGFAPPRVRKTLIFELEGSEEFLRTVQGDVHYVEYGSDRLRIEMSSIMPKGRFVTVVLIGPSVDRSGPDQYLDIIGGYLDLPHIRKLLPSEARLRTVCICSPNMTVGTARNPYADRAAVIGDLAVSRLNKDGIYSTYLTGSSLGRAILEAGVDERSLAISYGPVIRAIRSDNRFGALVFLLNRVAFRRPVISRILYQAVISERKKKDKEKRRLADIVWKIASGDDSYRRIFSSMFRPSSVAAIVTGGILVTVRNYITERLFGLRWDGFGRSPTGVPKELFQDRRNRLIRRLDLPGLDRPLDYERMYSIKIRGNRKVIFDQLGRFGDADRRYFRPRIVRVARVKGGANETGSVINYRMPLGLFSFSIVLERIVDGQLILYRVQNGFARGGVLVFEISEVMEGICLLTIYVSFDFSRGRSWLGRISQGLLRVFFPGFIHDVLWNHSLCEFREIVGEARLSP